jgi:aspartyl-tRNA(Asn)/glutamyl-tRNA(Gln) amidotransferase subunit C
MKTHRADLDHVATLARLAVPAEAAEALSDDLDRMVGLMDELAAIDVEGVEPLAHPLDLVLALRPDEVTEPDRSDDLLALAAEAQGGYYLVPKVIE